MSAEHVLQAVGLVTVVTYVVVMFAARAHLVAPASIRSLEGRIAALRADATASGLPTPAVLAVTQLVNEADAIAKTLRRFRDRIPSTGADENESWEMVHHAETIMLELANDDDVQAQLHKARAELAREKSSEDEAWRLVIARHLTADGLPTPTYSAPIAKADAVQLARYLHRKQDQAFRTLAEVANKAQWLVVAGATFIFATIVLAPSVVPVLGLGAVGGLASGARRIARSKTVPSDYGAYWAPLFVAPILGALLGWAGIYLVELAQELGVVGAALGDVSAGGTLTYALALLLGYSEGAFNGVANLVDAAVTAPRTGPAAAAGTAAQVPTA